MFRSGVLLVGEYCAVVEIFFFFVVHGHVNSTLGRVLLGAKIRYDG